MPIEKPNIPEASAGSLITASAWNQMRKAILDLYDMVGQVQPPAVTGTVSVSVKDSETNKPIPGATVFAAAAMTPTIPYKVAQPLGGDTPYYLIENMAPGEYVISVSVPGYNSQTERLIVTGGQSTERTVPLVRQAAPVQMPKLADLSLDEALSRLTNMKVRPAQVRDKNGANVPLDPLPANYKNVTVFQQDPLEGTPLSNTSRIVLVVQVPQVAVPDLTGMSEASAEQALVTAGLSMARSASSGAAPRRVASQKPAGGQMADLGSAVVVELESLPATVTLVLKDKDEKKPLAGANVFAALPGTPSMVFRPAKAGAAGEYTIENLPPGQYIISMSAPGFEALTWPVSVIPDQKVKQEQLLTRSIVMVAVPALTGMTLAQALEKLKQVGLAPGALLDDKGRTADPAKLGQQVVKGQEPAANSQVQAGTAVRLIVPAPTVQVPNVVGQRVEAAEQALAAAGLQVNRTGATAAPLKVAKQEPAAGAAVDPGTAVSLTLETALGHVQIVLKDDAGQIVNNATIFAALAATPSVPAKSATFSANAYLIQGLVPGEYLVDVKAPGHDNITAKVTVAPEATAQLPITINRTKAGVPNVVGQRVEDAERALTEKGFKIARTGASAAPLKVAGQNPAAGTAAVPGTTVTLTLETITGSVKVLVRQEGTGAVLTNGSVHVEGMGASRPTALRGQEFWLDGLVQGAYTLVVKAPGHADRSVGINVVAGQVVGSEVSLPVATRAVPDVRGQEPESAVAELEQAGFRVTVRTMAKTLPPFAVTSQSPNAGVQVAPGSLVTITVKGEPIFDGPGGPKGGGEIPIVDQDPLEGLPQYKRDQIERLKDIKGGRETF